ncbi:hypothetical protein BV898_03288 [Hypsibius exemplaris]|uniref:G-protein coupled receptors family 1 profile domain-containing protein n=1 Tax=Hypsibius exemplaris TaxID=2072580 RepID=A0A1W0X5N6_HYPEX|nr:hypothetical protein BV898_03288 [Hypsibius exemplaris]
MASAIAQQMMPNGNISKYCLVLPSTANISEEYPFFNTHPAIIVWTYLVGIFSVIGSAANLLVLTVVLLFSSLRKGVGILIPHLLVCHVAVCAVLCPLFLRAYTPKYLRPNACEECRYQEPFFLTLAYIINWSDTLLAINRFVAVLFPAKFALINRHLIQILAVMMSWCVVLLTTFPPMFDIWAVYRMSPSGVCTVVHTSKLAGFLASFHVCCPLLLLSISGVCIAVRLTVARPQIIPAMGAQVARSGPVGPPPAQTVWGGRQKRMSRMLLASFVCSLACQLPQFVWTLASYNSPRNPVVGAFLGLWALLQYGLIPMIYIIMNKDYQRKVAMLFCRSSASASHTQHSSFKPGLVVVQEDNSYARNNVHQ